MKFTARIKAAVLGTAMLAASTIAVSAPAAHAASCNPNPGGSARYPIATINLNTTWGSMGQLYLGYIPDCRLEYAEAHITEGTLYASDAHIWIQDAAGHRFGQKDWTQGGWPAKLDFSSPGWFTSALIPIDTQGPYYYSEAHFTVHSVSLAIGNDVGGKFTTVCPQKEYVSGFHNYYTGDTAFWNSHDTC
ncbi:hypothetical protein GCM10010193_32460 [Kitasatospora atroaurantiaca]|uniref:Hydrophobic W protein n=1 Tax=Kitasatospora atroaurantiaca TaxID=285545 RepID=A0A561ERI7_9ACTN|nr:hypothetical protein [Kitasatospora atroaurantiaca]TWE18231.1 hypothetical protein FB465_3282 [Kitasatospora atroaurantiaca]